MVERFLTFRANTSPNIFPPRLKIATSEPFAQRRDRYISITYLDDATDFAEFLPESVLTCPAPTGKTFRLQRLQDIDRTFYGQLTELTQPGKGFAHRLDFIQIREDDISVRHTCLLAQHPITVYPYNDPQPPAEAQRPLILYSGRWVGIACKEPTTKKDSFYVVGPTANATYMFGG